ncbi:uncharacterized protein LOC110677068 [Aedes aegypti]|uniref:Uncharacterized protein n=1 Tax=Aedes aegypti TaxID=7159 RepID=A0A6I8U079_AEDAE|nr:uncharacterized protein LOC110677068 [Aedes aegypti]
MKFTIAVLALVLVIVATEASPVAPYTAGLVAYDNAWPHGGAAWSPYGYGAYGNAHYGYRGWPLYGKGYGYSSAWAPTVVSTKVVDGGLWNYGPYGHGYGLGYSKYW